MNGLRLRWPFTISVSRARSLALEIDDWDDLIEEYPGQPLSEQTLSFWNQPKKGLEWGVNNAFSSSIYELGAGQVPNARLVQDIYDDWVVSCGYQEKLDMVGQMISKYADALEKIRSAIRNSLISGGFIQQNENLLTRVSVQSEDGYQFPVVEFFPMSHDCTYNLGQLNIEVTSPGKTDADGVKAADYVEDYWDLVGTQGMSLYELGTLKPNSIGFYSDKLLVNKAKVSRATCD